jgi:hypothetical protein
MRMTWPFPIGAQQRAKNRGSPDSMNRVLKEV